MVLYFVLCHSTFVDLWLILRAKNCKAWEIVTVAKVVFLGNQGREEKRKIR